VVGSYVIAKLTKKVVGTALKGAKRYAKNSPLPVVR
jgi:hypothetical protein